MNYGEVFSSAARFTWKHKALWIPPLVVTLTALLYSALSSLISTLEMGSLSTRQATAMLLYSLLSLFLSLGYLAFAFFAGAAQFTIILWAALQPAPTGPFDLLSAWKGSKPFYWRVLGILVVFSLATSILFVPFVCLALSIALPFSNAFTSPGTIPANTTPMTLAILCLLVPFIILFTAILEQFALAVIAENCSFGAAVQRGFRFIGKNFGVLFLSAIILGLLLIVMSLPFGYLPIWLIQKFIAAVVGGGSALYTAGYGIAALICAPIYMISSALVFVFCQSAWASIYRRLTAQPSVPAEAVQAKSPNA